MGGLGGGEEEEEVKGREGGRQIKLIRRSRALVVRVLYCETGLFVHR